MKEVDDLKEFLNKAHGEITIKVDGMIPHVEGNINVSAEKIMTWRSGNYRYTKTDTYFVNLE